MIFAAFLLIGILVSYGVKTKLIRENLVFPIILIMYVVSLLPSLIIPYIIDDLDHLTTLSLAIDTNHVREWITAPHNEHVMPIIKSLYYFAYNNFGIDPMFMHLVIIFIAAANLWLVYRLLSCLMPSSLIPIIGAAIFAGSNLMDLSLFVICDTHIHYSLLFLLLLFYAQFKYFSTKKSGWLWVVFLSTLLAPLTFGLAHVSLFAAYLFEKFCIPATYHEKKKTSLVFVAAGWIIGLIPYFLNINKIIHTNHYHDIGGNSAFDKINIFRTLHYLGSYFYNDFFLYILPDLYLAAGLLFLCVYATWTNKNQIKKAKLLFPLFFGFFPTLIVYVFRSQWGTIGVQHSRYDVFPLVGVIFLYAFLLEKWFEQKNTLKERYYLHVLILCFVIVSLGSAYRYDKAQRLAKETSGIIQIFYLNYHDAFTGFFKANAVDKIAVKRTLLNFPLSPTLADKKGFNPPLTRYGRGNDFFAQFLLPKNIRERIVWSDTATDPRLLNYLKNPQNSPRYQYFIGAVQ